MIIQNLLTRKVLLGLLALCLSKQLLALTVSTTALCYHGTPGYVEVYSKFMGSTMMSNDQGGVIDKSGSISMLILIKKGAEIEIAEKYHITSPSTDTLSDFWDFKRLKLTTGAYSLSIQYVDLNKLSDTINYEQPLLIKSGKNQVCHSNLLLMNEISDKEDFPFSKSGFFFEPPPFNLYGPMDSVMVFYTEVKGILTHKQPLYYKFSILSEDGEIVTKPAFKKLSVDSTSLILEQFKIENLTSGNYQFSFEIIDKEKKYISGSSQKFSVYHPATDFKVNYEGDKAFETSFVQLLDEGEVNYALKAIFPRVGNKMSGLLNQITWGDDLKVKRYFLYNFWTQFSAEKPKEVYDKYMDVVRAVDREFASNFGHGFETDRGYIFLKYGKPNDVVSVEDEPSAPPYDIWIYNFLEETNQTAVKFLFYNPSLVTNDYELLHSTCRGELSNPKWEVELYKDDQSSIIDNPVDANSVRDGFNRQARRYFTDY